MTKARVKLWYTLPDTSYLRKAVLSSLLDAVETYNESVKEGDEEDFSKLLGDIVLRGFEYDVRYGLKIEDVELIAPAIGNLLHFLEDVALSLVYVKKGKNGIKSLSAFPLDINPLKTVDIGRSMFSNDSLKLLFGTFEPTRTYFLHKQGNVLEIKSSDDNTTIHINADEYVDNIKNDLLSGIYNVEEILKMHTLLGVLRPKVQWLKVMMRYALK
ncbi:hypothetical protein [Palaeococcus ferrophilus]|uniref:hypothetical protein n=1 Tax=Palaeococcus ferrophilus TaxID=83868 RepID=UPI00064E8E52|nr:hypothetical protein [Palaeococcus ferrophilus]